jgi:deoxyinosine 3'endonuclease (endonuclease V)
VTPVSAKVTGNVDKTGGVTGVAADGRMESECQRRQTASSPALALSHPDRAKVARWTEEQNVLKGRLSLEDSFDVESVRLVGGADISFVKDDPERACACLVVMRWPSCEVVAERSRMIRLTEPYVPGFLAFRECPHLLALLEELRRDLPERVPEILFVDGNGVLHHRGFGLASQLGVLGEVPTIGIGKNLLCVDGLDLDVVRGDALRALASDAEGREQSVVELRGVSGTVHGAAVLRRGQRKPIFVSAGHGVSLKTAVVMTLASQRGLRLPAPVRAADIASRLQVRKSLERESERKESR